MPQCEATNHINLDKFIDIYQCCSRRTLKNNMVTKMHIHSVSYQLPYYNFNLLLGNCIYIINVLYITSFFFTKRDCPLQKGETDLRTPNKLKMIIKIYMYIYGMVIDSLYYQNSSPIPSSLSIKIFFWQKMSHHPTYIA